MVLPAELLIFDFDGVVLDSARIKAEAFVELFAERGEQYRAAIAAVHQRMHGTSRFEQFEVVHREVLRCSLDSEASAELGRRYSELCDERVLQCPPIGGALQFLRRNMGRVPIWVASGSPHDDLLRVVRARRLGEFFERVFGAPKKKARVAKEALDHHAAQPQRTIFVGDALADQDAARDAGVHFIGVVAPGVDDPFAPGTPVIPDLTQLEQAIHAVLGRLPVKEYFP